MFITENNTKENMVAKGIIYGLIIFILTFNTFNLITIFYGESTIIQYSGMERFIVAGDILLATMVVICCYTFYYIYKEDDMFIIIQIFTITSVEFVIRNTFFKSIQIRAENNYDIISLLYIFESLILALILYKNNKFVKPFLKHKVLLGLIIPLFPVLVWYGRVNINFNKNIITSLLVFLIAYQFYIVFILLKKSLSHQKVIYGIFAVSINILNVKTIYEVLFLHKYFINIYVLGLILVFISFFVLIVGLFVEMIFRFKESEELRYKLGIFYEATENNHYSNVLVYDENFNIIYANKLARTFNGTIKWETDDQYRYIKEALSFSNNKEKSNLVKDKLLKEGSYSGVYTSSESGKSYKIYMQQSSEGLNKRYLATYADISDEYKALESLKVSESKLKSITENILDLIVTADVNGKITYVNSSTLDSLGYKEEEIIGINYEEILVDDINEEMILNNLLKNTLIKHDLRCKDGHKLTVESVVQGIINDTGEVTDYIIVSRSTMVKKQLEEMKIKYNEIKEYDRIRGEFFANLSHEVRTPINIINSCLQLLNKQKENGSEELEKYYIKYEKTIKQNSFRLLRLVNNLIDISKLDSGFATFNIENVDIISLIEDITLSVVPYVEEKGIEIMFDTDCEELIIGCDSEKIERAMLNLISNAVKFTKVGGKIVVDIKTDKEWISIRVIDTGIGVSMNLKDVIFERFVQSNKSFSREREGSGIGLALVKFIIEEHKGEVSLESSSNEGSTFLIKLPNVKIEEYEIIEERKEAARPKISDRIDIEFSDIYDE